MKCKNCGADMPDDQDVCSVCGAQIGADEQTDNKNEEKQETTADAESAAEPVAEEAAEPAAEEVAEMAAEEAAEPVAEATEPIAEAAEPVTEAAESAAETAEPAAAVASAAAQQAPKKKGGKIVIGAVAAAAVVAAGAFGLSKVNEKDPKQVVIDAFESVYPEGQVYPIDELFGITKFADAVGTANAEGSLTLKLDSCSDENANAYAGSGLRIGGKSDITNKKSSAEIAAIYNGMDLAKMEVYYGDDMLMMALPELSGKVFTLDLGDGLADRITQSPVVGPLMEENGVDAAGIAEYLSELMDEAEKNQAEGKRTYDFEGLWNRYKEGSKAQENFKAALTVEQGEKKDFTMDGAQVSCKGYHVMVSKASMMDFLRTSSDFFLQDEELKKQYLRQLEMTVKMSGFMGGNLYGDEIPSAEELQQQTYEEMSKNVSQILDTLDKTLDDVTMTVYVDKKGRLAAVEGTTILHNDSNTEETVNAAFHAELSGGAYLTQNATLGVTLTDPNDAEKSMTMDLVKQGTYDGKLLTSDWSGEFTSAPENEKYNISYTGTYNSDGGDYHASLETGDAAGQFLKFSATGRVDSLEKGVSVHVYLDELEIDVQGGSYSAVLSGEYGYQPLTGEVTAPEGEQMDVLAATEADWQGVFMEMLYGVMGLMGQMGVPLY